MIEYSLLKWEVVICSLCCNLVIIVLCSSLCGFGSPATSVQFDVEDFANLCYAMSMYTLIAGVLSIDTFLGLYLVSFEKTTP